jgi:membrane protein DedA with SNARE-associated domain
MPAVPLVPLDQVEGSRPRRPYRRRTLVLLVTPIVAMTVIGTVADILAPAIIDKRPLLQMFLNPRNRYLVLAAPQVDPLPFFLVGFFRLTLTDPLGYLLGYFYGDAALRWIESKLGEDRETGLVAMIEKFFAKASYVIVVVAPNLYVCILAGATGMRPRVFFTLNILGTVGRLALVWWAGDVFEEELDGVLDFIAENRLWLLGLSVVVVGFQVWRGRKSGALETVGEIEDEIEQEIERMEREDAPE